MEILKSAWCRQLGYKVRFCRHNKVVDVQTVYLMGPPINGDFTPFGLDGGMMVLALRQTGNFIGKAECVAELNKVKLPDEFFNAIVELPFPAGHAQSKELASS